MRPDATSRRASFLLRIREARPEEHDALEALKRRASLALPDHRAVLEANPDALRLPAARIDVGQVFVAESDEGVVGFAVVVVEPLGAELEGLFVEPAQWCTGVGTALAEAATHEARRRGLALTVIADPAARPFYEKCGFAVEGVAQTRFGPALRMSK